MPGPPPREASGQPVGQVRRPRGHLCGAGRGVFRPARQLHRAVGGLADLRAERVEAGVDTVQVLVDELPIEFGGRVLRNDGCQRGIEPRGCRRGLHRDGRLARLRGRTAVRGGIGGEALRDRDDRGILPRRGGRTSHRRRW